MPMTTSDRSSNDHYSRGVRRVLVITLVLNLAVVAVKLVVGILAQSLSIVSDALHSSADSFNNVVALIVIRIASAAPDEDHHFGHHKFETLGAFVIAGFLAVTSFEVASSAVRRILGRETSHVEVTPFTLAAMVLTITVNVLVWAYESRRARDLGSSILLADSKHTLSDIFVSLSILAGLLMLWFKVANLDAVLALLVSGVIAYAAYQIFSATAPVLVDRSPFPRDYIAEVVRATPGVKSVHDIKSRGVPGNAFITMHLAVTPVVTSDAHAVTEEVERRLEAKLGPCHVTIHIEPEDQP
jgi:cation diffusion facilitator family transporter